MKPEVFEVIKLALQLLLVVMTTLAIPALKRWIDSKTTAEQRKEAEYWITLAVQVAERIYKDKGQGPLKKEWVMKWLSDNGVKLTAEQLDVLIDMIVEEFNKNGWNKAVIPE